MVYRQLQLPRSETLMRHALPALIALVTAETLFRFGSFTLELVAFAALWKLLHSAGTAWSLRGRGRPAE